MIRSLYLAACSSLIALIFLCLAWELRLAPVQPGGILAGPEVPAAAATAVRHPQRPPLLVPVGLDADPAVLHRGHRARHHRDTEQAQALAISETVLSLIFFCASVGYARLTRPSAR
jgi:uncharacterized membrane protein